MDPWEAVRICFGAELCHRFSGISIQVDSLGRQRPSECSTFPARTDCVFPRVTRVIQEFLQSAVSPLQFPPKWFRQGRGMGGGGATMNQA